MANRMISYGYGIDGNAVRVIDSEAEVVRNIYDKYINGTKLDDIAKELTLKSVEYFQGNAEWNKNRVCRIIENKKYVGLDNYPQIIDVQIFEKANFIKSGKGAKKQRQVDEVEYLKKKLICGQCGRVLTRRLKWRSREKWICSNGCKQDVYLDDAYIYNKLSEIIVSIKEDKSILEDNTCRNNVNANIELIKSRNVLRNLMDKDEVSFNQCKKIIFEMASMKFNLCEENIQETHNETIIEEVEKYIKTNTITTEMIRKIFSEIKINQDGTISVLLKNGKKITSKQEVNNGRSSKEKDNNEDRCQSFVVSTKDGNYDFEGGGLLPCVNG